MLFRLHVQTGGRQHELHRIAAGCFVRQIPPGVIEPGNNAVDGFHDSPKIIPKQDLSQRPSLIAGQTVIPGNHLHEKPRHGFPDFLIGVPQCEKPVVCFFDRQIPHLCKQYRRIQ